MAFDKQALLRYFLINYRLLKTPPPTAEELRQYVEEEFKIIADKEISVSKGVIKQDIRTMKKVFFAPISFSFTSNCYKYDNPQSSFLKLPQVATEYFTNFLRLQYLLGPEYYNKDFLWYNDHTIVGNDKIPFFAKAILEQKQVRLTYRPFNSKRTHDYTVHPFFIKEAL